MVQLLLLWKLGDGLVIVVSNVIVWGLAACMIFWILAGVYVLSTEALRAVGSWLWSQLHPEIYIVTDGVDSVGCQQFKTFWSESKARKYADSLPTRTLHRAYLR